MLYHHDSLPYAVKLEQCGQKTRETFQRQLAAGRDQLPKALEALQTVPDDALIKADAVVFEFNDKKPLIGTIENPDVNWRLHPNAWQQICQKTGFPLQYGDKLNDSDWGRDLISTNLNTIFRNAPADKRFLVRSVRGEARAFLSDRFRRLDMRPIADRMFRIAQDVGAVVLSATATDIKAEIKFGFPQVLEPVLNEPILYFVGFRSSDFGDSKWEIFNGIDRCWCTNFARVETYMSQVHLGKQLPENIEFSQETYRKDTEYVISASNDIFRDAFSEKKVALLCEKMKKLSEMDAPKNIDEALRRAGLSKKETEDASLIYAIPDIEVLPKENTMWRFSNVISFMAGQATSPDRKLELEAIAGAVIAQVKPEPIEARLVNVG